VTVIDSIVLSCLVLYNCGLTTVVLRKHFIGVDDGAVDVQL